MVRAVSIVVCVFLWGNMLSQEQPNELAALLNRLEQSSGKERFNILNQIGKEYVYRDSISLAISYFEQAISEGESYKNELDIQVPYRSIGNLYLIYWNPDSAYHYLKQSQRICIKKEDEENLLLALTDLSELFARQAYFDSARICLQQALFLTVKQKRDIAIVSIMNTLANVYALEGNDKEAIKLYLDASKRCKELSFNKELIVLYNNLGNQFLPINTSIARYYYNAALGFNDTLINSSMASTLFLNRGITYLTDNLADSAQNDFMKSLILARSNSDSVILAKNYHAIANSWVAKDDCNRATLYLDSLSLIIDNLKLTHSELYYFICKGSIYHCKGIEDIAIKFFLMALEISKENMMVDEELVIYKALSTSYKAIGKYREAILALDQENELRNKVFPTKMINELVNIHYKSIEDEKLSQIFAKDKIETKNADRAQIILFVIIGLLLISWVPVLVFFRKSRRFKGSSKNELLLNELKVSIEKLLQKNDNLLRTDHVNDQVVAISKKISKVSKVISGDAKEEFEKLSKEISSYISNGEKQTMLAHLEESSLYFYKNLTILYPELTSFEQQLCGLIRLDFSTKEIANALNRSIGTIDNHRSLIRRKMKLNGDENLTEILQKL